MTSKVPPDFRPFFFDREELRAIADAHRDEFRSAEPFPFVVLDDFLPADVANRLLAEFPEPEQAKWFRRQGYGFPATPQQDGSNSFRVEGKLECQDPEMLGPLTRQVLAELNSGVFLEFLERLTGVERLLPDPHLGGGGLHSVGLGGRLRVHADFVWAERINLDRRLNLLLYLNKGWTAANGGELELWDADMTGAVHSIAPVFNRCVVFATSSKSFHGHPNPVQGPPGLRRRSLALYYYTNGRPDGEVEDWHGEATLWQLTPREKSPARTFLRRYTPPFLLDLARYVRRELRGHKLIPPALRAKPDRRSSKPG